MCSRLSFAETQKVLIYWISNSCEGNTRNVLNESVGEQFCINSLVDNLIFPALNVACVQLLQVLNHRHNNTNETAKVKMERGRATEEEAFVIEEIVYVDEHELQDTAAVEISADENSSTERELDDDGDTVASSTSTTAHERSEQEGNLIKKFISGELSFSEYNKQMDKNDSDEENDATLIDSDSDTDETGPSAISKRTKASQHFEDELHKSRKDALRGILKGRDKMRDGRHRRRCVLPAALQGLMGEANLRYARGQNELAEKVCLEIIRQVPLAPEPFLTLAQIHDSNPDKYLQFSLIAAHLNPADSEQWVRIAQFYIEQNDVRRAINCYTKAIKFNPKDIDLRLKRIELLESIKDEKMASRCWFSLVFIIPVEEAQFLMQTGKRVAEQLIQAKKYAKAMEIMAYLYRRVSRLFRNEDLNQLFELLITNNDYKQVIDILCGHTDAKVTYKQESKPSTSAGGAATVATTTAVDHVFIPKVMILDFRSKLIVCLVNLRAFHLMDQLVGNILDHINVESAGDCYLDVAEALMKVERYADAIRLLRPLVQSSNYSLAAVWLRYADCFRATADFDRAIESYAQVVSMAPQHFDARLTLAALLKQQGRDGEALQALEQNLECDLIDPVVLYERCFMLKAIGDIDQYVTVAMLLISRHCIRLRNAYEMFVVTHTSKHSNKVQLIRENRRARKEPIEDEDGPEFVRIDDSQPSVDEEFNLLRDVLQVLYERGNVALMQRFAFTTLSSRRLGLFYGRQMYFYALLSAIFNRDSQFGFVLIKDLVVKHMRNHRIWNLFNVLIQCTDYTWRYSRFLNRLLNRSELGIDEWPKILRANYCIVSGTYKYALDDYMRIYKHTRSALVALLIGVTYMSIAQQRFTTKKQMLIAQAISFLNTYAKIREPEAYAEIQYNLGRLHHQCGMCHIAVHHYKQVLNYTNELTAKHPKHLDLRREAAFNLHLIYKKSGNVELARKILYDYIVV